MWKIARQNVAGDVLIIFMVYLESDSFLKSESSFFVQ